MLVKMEVSGICGTDKHAYQGYTGQHGGSGATRQIPFPIIQDHENVGTIAAIGGIGKATDFEGRRSEAAIGLHFLITVVKTHATMETVSVPRIRRTCSAADRNISTLSQAACGVLPDELPLDVAVLTEITGSDGWT